jgi:ribosomal protein RSM22 (predicted rRNA methylase)
MIALERAIAKALVGERQAGLPEAARDLSEGYRARQVSTSSGLSDQAVAAYLASRLPATAGACRRALDEVAKSLAGFTPSTQLDLGAGPGAAAWAAEDLWPAIESVVLVDRDVAMIQAGTRLRAAAGSSTWSWQRADLEVWAGESAAGPGADLVTVCYVLGELAPALAWRVVERAWSATTGCLVLVEPGTPVGFGLIRHLRSRMIELGASLVAPCPQEGTCPITQGDWCHFAARVNRSSLHRQLKAGERSFEDEKFSYVAFSRSQAKRAVGRVVRRPTRRRRLVELSVCRGQDIARVAIGQSSADYRAAVKLGWGDSVPPTMT